MTKKTEKTDDVIESSVVADETQTDEDSKLEKSPEIFARFFYTILFFIIGWLSLWVFSFVVLIQFGFLLITGQINTNLKGFNKEVGLYLYDLMKYLSFQSASKPFPFREWPYDENEKSTNNTELNKNSTVEVSK